MIDTIPLSYMLNTKLDNFDKISLKYPQMFLEDKDYSIYGLYRCKIHLNKQYSICLMSILSNQSNTEHKLEKKCPSILFLLCILTLMDLIL